MTSMARVVERAAEGDLRRRAMSAGRRRGYWGRRFVGSMRVSNLLWMMPAMGPTVARMVWRVLRMALCRGILLYLQEKRWSPKWSQSLRQWRQVGGAADWENGEAVFSLEEEGVHVVGEATV